LGIAVFTQIESSSATTNRLLIVRLETVEPEVLQDLSTREILVLAQFTRSDGRSVLFALINPQDLAYPLNDDVQLKVVEAYNPDEPYYLVFPPKYGNYPELDSDVAVLDQSDEVVLMRAPFEKAEALPTLGYRIRRLYPHPLVLGDTELSSLSQVTAPDPEIEHLIDQVSQDGIYTHIGDLTGEREVMVNGKPYTILTRYTRTDIPIKKATRYAFEYFNQLGLKTYYFHYNLPVEMGTVEKRNVIAEQTGLLLPDGIVLLIGHLDSTSYNPYIYAPGADDNASGSAGVMQVAEVLSHNSFDYTIRYVLFTGEEQGLYGSQAYAQYLAEQGENLVAVIDLDMIGYNSDQDPVLEFHIRKGNSGDSVIANLLSDVIAVYKLDLIPQIVKDGLSYSDHAPFWNRGYAAVLSVEDLDDSNPNYHTTGDRLSNINLTYNTEIIKAAVAAVAHIAQPLRPFSAYIPLTLMDVQASASPQVPPPAQTLP
jgi:hypothetical protein